MRILLTSPCAWPEVRRGGERYVHELAASLARRGHEVQMLSAAPSPYRDRWLDVPVRRLRRRSPRWARRFGSHSSDVAFAVQVAALLLTRRLRADVWHATSLPEAAVAAVLSRRWPRGPRSLYADQGLPHALLATRWPDRPFFRTVVRDVDAYTVNAPAWAEMLSDHSGRGAIVAPAGVHLERYEAGQRSPCPTVLYTGALDVPRKNVNALLAAFELLRRQLPTATLVLAGPGASPARVPDGVEVVGELDDDALATAYATAWLTALPSHHESLGLSLVESLASGTPGLALAGEAGPGSLLTPETGVLAGSEAPDDLASAMVRGLELAARVGTVAACRARAREWDWDEVIAPRFESVYQALLRD